MRRFLMTGVVVSPSALFLLLLHSVPAHAIEALYSHRDLITDSEVIVIATLKDLRSYMKGGLLVEEGYLHVERVVCGDVKVGDAPRLRWQNHPNVACPRVEHARNANQSRLWFLERDATGSLTANTNQRAWPVDELETFLDSLAAYPYHVVTPRYDAGDRVIVTIEFHNATVSPLTVPTIKLADGHVAYSRGFAMAFHPRYERMEPTPVVVRPGTLVQDDALERTTLAPGASYRVELAFSDVLEETPPGLYRFDVRVDGHRTTHGLHIRSAWETGLERVRGTSAEFAYHIQTIRTGRAGTDASIILLQERGSEGSFFANELMALSDSLETKTRLQVMGMIPWLNIPPDSRMDYYLERIDNPIPEIRAAAGGGVGRVLQDRSVDYRRDEAIALLMSLLDDENAIVRRAAVSAFWNAGASIALPSLKFFARYDGDLEIRREARRVVNAMEGRNPCSDRAD